MWLKSLQSFSAGRCSHLLQGSWITCLLLWLCWWHLCPACKGSLDSWFTLHYTPKLGTTAEFSLSGITWLFQWRIFAVQWDAEATQNWWRWQGMSWRPAGHCRSVSSDTNANIWQWNAVTGVYCQWEKITLEMPVSVGQSLEGQLRLDFQLLAGEMNHTLWKIGVLMVKCVIYICIVETLSGPAKTALFYRGSHK